MKTAETLFHINENQAWTGGKIPSISLDLEGDTEVSNSIQAFLSMCSFGGSWAADGVRRTLTVQEMRWLRKALKRAIRKIEGKE